ncbi:hypothetical protein LTS10_003319 [Elasticomyces elasticus]|nr:hypothetical protein LTS10_003319 [Elasticomyces elasticus]
MRRYYEDMWKLSNATVGFQFGAENAHRYGKAFPTAIPVVFCKEQMYGRDVHAYMEMESDGKTVKRLTFLIHHPEAFLRGIAYLRPSLLSTITSVSRSIAFFGHVFDVVVPPTTSTLQDAYKRAGARTGLELWNANGVFVPGVTDIRHSFDRVSGQIVTAVGAKTMDACTTRLAKLYNRLLWFITYEAGLGIHVPPQDWPAEYHEFLEYEPPEQPGLRLPQV